jgi:integrase
MSVNRRDLKRGSHVYDVRLRTPDGASYKRTFRTKREAELFEAQQLADRSRGTWVDPRAADRRFEEVASEWVESTPAKRPSTRTQENVILRAHVLPTLGNCRLGGIRPRDLQNLVNAWMLTAKARTVRRRFDVVRAVLRYAVDQEYLGRSPGRSVKLPVVEQVIRRMPTPNELALVAREIGPDSACMVYLGAALGLRWGEVAGLRVARIDFLRSTVTVAEQITRGERGRNVIGPPKSNAGIRTMTMPAGLQAMLAAHLARRGLTGATPDAFVFVAADGEPLRYDRWRRRVWDPACERACLPDLTFHDLRRANATVLVAEGVDIKMAQARLGHSDVRLTIGLYAQATSEGDRAASDALDRRFFPPVEETRAMDAP